MLKDMSYEVFLLVDYFNYNLRVIFFIVFYKVMEDLLRFLRIVNGVILNNKIVLNSLGFFLLLNLYILVVVVGNFDVNYRVVFSVGLNYINIILREVSIVGNVSNFLDNIFYLNFV